MVQWLSHLFLPLSQKSLCDVSQNFFGADGDPECPEPAEAPIHAHPAIAASGVTAFCTSFATTLT